MKEQSGRKKGKTLKLTKQYGEYNIGLAGCGMGLKIEAGCGIREILRAE